MPDYSIVRKLNWDGDVLHVHDAVREISSNIEFQTEDFILKHFDADMSDLREYLRDKAEWHRKQESAIPKWTPITTRPMSEDERKEWSKRLGYDIEYEDAHIFISPLPDDGEEVLKCNNLGEIMIDTFRNDDGECYFDYSGDMDGIVAWMPLPKPYKPPKEEA